MSPSVYDEPHKFSAGALALFVHGIFFTLLFFGFNWHAKYPQNIQVDMWDSLPDPVPEIAAAPPPPPPPAPEPVVAPKVVEPVVPAKGEIELKEQKKKKNERAKKDKKEKAPEKAPPKEEKAKPVEPDPLELAKQHAEEERAAKEEERSQALKAKMRAEIEAATQSEVDHYKELIQAKIKRNINALTDVPENAEAIFMVIVLPGGAVMDNVKLLKSSGNAAYDSAAERAIYKSQPLPIPQDPALARLFRELRLSVKP